MTLNLFAFDEVDFEERATPLFNYKDNVQWKIHQSALYKTLITDWTQLLGPEVTLSLRKVRGQ